MRVGIAPDPVSRGVYFYSWIVEGSRQRRTGVLAKGRETTICVVEPDRVLWPGHLSESGAGTAFLKLCGAAIARVTQHHPQAKRKAGTRQN
jgi:hypothetical protein